MHIYFVLSILFMGRLGKWILTLTCEVTNDAMHMETSTDPIGRRRSTMAYWEVVVSLVH